MNNVMSLFNGLGGLCIALNKNGTQFNTFYYAEIDKYANKVMEHNYPASVGVGDVTKWKEWDVDWGSIDLITAGFPCQSWSVAGQQKGDKDERGMLFWVTLDIIAHVLKCNPNAKFIMENVKMKKDFEEYITHHTTEALGYVEKTLINSSLVSAQNRQRYYWTNFEVTQPSDKGISLKDILEVRKDEKTNALTTVQKDNVVVLKNESATKDNKSYSLTASYGGAVAWNSCQKKQRTMIPVCESSDSSPNIYNGVLYRKLTPVECERLQNIPDNYTSCVSNTQRYKMIGNGWTTDVICHILKCMDECMSDLHTNQHKKLYMYVNPMMG